jgi:AcrR family transcriptional regulator
LQIKERVDDRKATPFGVAFRCAYPDYELTSSESEGRRLPAGAHGIPVDVVERNQRERLTAAAAEACAEKGYAGISVTDLTRRAGLSTATFYRLFAGKRDCVLAAHVELAERLLEEVDRACADAQDGEAKIRAAVHIALELLAADPPTARLLSVEILALGPEGSARHDEALEAFASRLRDARGAAGDPSRPHADWGLVAAMTALVGRLVMAGDAARLSQLEDELVVMLTAPG